MKQNTTRPEGPIVILGGGPAGLGAAFMLDRSGHDDWVLFERDDGVGGLAKSIRDEKGYTWDLGGHVAFSHYGLFTRLQDELLGEAGWIEHERESWIRLLDTWVPYPFQNNIHRLPPEERATCIAGLIHAALHRSPAPFTDFDDFIIRTFGQGVADLFMRPYNSKVWAYHPRKLDAGWIADRVSVPDPVRVARNLALDQDDCAWGPNNLFRFPKHGGTGAIWTTLARRFAPEKIRTGCAAVEVDPERRTVRLSTGETVSYGTLISTIPIDRLAAMSGRSDWIEAASELIYSSTHIIGLGIEGTAPPTMKTKCWMYFPEDNCPFYRVTHFSFYSPNNVDDISKHWSLMCEVSESSDKPVDGARVVDDAIQGAEASGLIDDPRQVIHTWSTRVEHSYPVPSRGRDAVVERLLPELRKCGILSRGRFGAWGYEVGNMDHSFMQGLEAVGHILHGSPELTLWYPDVVNRPHPVLGWDSVG